MSAKQPSITFRDFEEHTRVYLEGVQVGTILPGTGGRGGWFYQPLGSALVGETLVSRQAVKISLMN